VLSCSREQAGLIARVRRVKLQHEGPVACVHPPIKVSHLLGLPVVSTSTHILPFSEFSMIHLPSGAVFDSMTWSGLASVADMGVPDSARAYMASRTSEL
jgi:hypothetical protein